MLYFLLHSLCGSGVRRFKLSLQVGSSVLHFAIYGFPFYSHPTGSLRFAHCRLTWTAYSIYSQLTSININTKIPPQFSPSNVIQISPLCSHANSNITAETKHIKRLTSFLCCILKIIHLLSPYF